MHVMWSSETLILDSCLVHIYFSIDYVLVWLQRSFPPVEEDSSSSRKAYSIRGSFSGYNPLFHYQMMNEFNEVLFHHLARFGLGHNSIV